jgi:HK97 family phage prohead protease
MVTPFGVETTIGDLKRGGFKEEIAPGTFTKTLSERAVVLIHNHDTAMPMASTAVPDGEDGHLSLTQEPNGFMARAFPLDTTYANDVRKATKILGMSFGFEVTKDDWFDSEGRASNPQAGTKRVIREVKLHEVSTTAFPAYTSTMGTVSARDTINAARGVESTRAAKASYEDLETCAECGATSQYGKYCGDCGEPMGSPTHSSDFCTSCGSEIDDSSRASHVCAKETRTVSAEIDAALDAAFSGITGVDRNALPAEVNQFIDLASAALKLASADLKDSGIPDPDNPNGNDYSPDDGERSEPVETTPETDSQHSANVASMRHLKYQP